MLSEKVSKRALSNQTGIQRKSITNWLNAKFYPRYDALIKLADYFYVSTDYIIGKSDDASKIMDCVKNSPVSVPFRFAGLLNNYLVKEKLSKYMLAKKIKKYNTLNSIPQ